MIEIDNLEEYQSIKAILNYADNLNLNTDDCEKYCKLNDICNCSDIKPCSLNCQYIPKESEE